MKIQYFLFNILILFLISCTSKSLQLEKKFKDDQVVIAINASKNSSMNPWKVTIKVKAYKLQEGSLMFEHQKANLNSNDITFNWVSETECIIGFPYEDGKIRKFQLDVSPDNYQLLEISE